jgi:hypothetical protein
MIGIDMFAAVVLAIALILSNVRTIPSHVRHWVFAIAMFVIAGNRLLRGGEGSNLFVVPLALGFGIKSAVDAYRAQKASASASKE